MRLLVIILGLILSLSLAGCSDSKSTTAEKKNDKVTTENVDKNEDTQSKVEGETQPVEAEAVEAEETFEEISFKNVNWFFGSPELQAKGGVWVYTKDKHSGELEDTFDWEKEDALLVQINDPKHKNNELKVTALQIVDDETVKIVVSFTPIENPSEEKTPRRYATIEKDSLKGKKFIVESQEGDAVKLN